MDAEDFLAFGIEDQLEKTVFNSSNLVSGDLVEIRAADYSVVPILFAGFLFGKPNAGKFGNGIDADRHDFEFATSIGVKRMANCTSPLFYGYGCERWRANHVA